MQVVEHFQKAVLNVHVQCCVDMYYPNANLTELHQIIINGLNTESCDLGLKRLDS